MTKTALYRHFDADGVLLYVGISGDTDLRMRSHQRSVDLPAQVSRTIAEWFETRDTAIAAETASIQAEEPLFNSTNRAFPKAAPADIGWRERLQTEVNRRRISMRAASLAAGLGQNYLREVLSDGKEPTINNLFAICAGAGIDIHFILFGTPSRTSAK